MVKERGKVKSVAGKEGCKIDYVPFTFLNILNMFSR